MTFRKLVILTFSITRDNTSLNDTLLKAFIKYYNKQGIKFQGDIPYIAHIVTVVYHVRIVT